MPATFEEIQSILTSTEFTKAEKLVVEWQFRLCGDFQMALWKTICLADEDNLAKLEEGFPLHVEGFKAWAWGTLGRRLRDKGLDI